MEPLQQLTLPKNMNKSFYQFRLFPRTNTFNNWIVFVLIILSFSFIIADDKIISDLTQPDKEANRSCDGLNLYCSPQDNDAWAVNDIHVVKWNDKYPSIQTNSLIDLQLFISDNARQPIFSKNDLPSKGGQISVKISRDQFYLFNSPSNSNDLSSYITKSAWFVIKAAGSQSSDGGKGPVFRVIDFDPPRSSSSTTESPKPTLLSTIATSSTSEENKETASPSLTPEIQNDNHKSDLPIPIYGIVLIALAGLLLFLIPLLYFLWRRRNKKGALRNETLEKSYIIGNPSGGTIGARRLGSTSSTGFGATGSRSSAITGDSMSPISLNPTNLTANDAIMLSETFREMMRKPSWNQNEMNEDHAELDEDLEDQNKNSSTRLEEELALSGVGLHELDSKKNLTIVHDLEGHVDENNNHTISSPSSSLPKSLS